MAKVIGIGKTVDYILEDDRKSTSPTIFKIGALDARSDGWIKDQSMESKIVVDERDRRKKKKNQKGEIISVWNQGKTNVMTVQFGLKGWKNLTDLEGNVLEFVADEKVINGKTYTVASDESMDLITSFLSELTAAILTINEISEESEGN